MNYRTQVLQKLNRHLLAKWKWLAAILLAAISYQGWTYVSSVHGDQKVSYAPSKKECFERATPVKWSFCIHTAAQGTNGSVAYLLHGRNLDVQTWNDDTFYTAMIQKEWRDKNVKPPTVVTVSFGPIWLLTPHLSQSESGLLDVFTKDVLPEVEKHTGIPKTRIVFGESMGGLNTLIVALKSGALFQRAAALCPGVYIDSPFASLSEIKMFLNRTGADPKIIYGVISLAKKYAANDSEWQEISPLSLLGKANAKDSPELYISNGLYDAYGNFEGAEKLAAQASQLGSKVYWHPIYGGHCAIDIPSLAEFLAHE